MPNAFDANNPVKLELFYHYFRVTSYFEKVPGWQVSIEEDYYSGFGLNFNTKEDMRKFLSSYGLSPTDIPKADTLNNLSKIQIKMGYRATKPIDIRENNKRVHKKMLEDQWIADSIADKKSNRQDIEDEMRKYENASDSVRNQMGIDLWNEMLRRDSVKNKTTGQNQQKSTPNLTVSIKNIRNFENSSRK